MNQYFTFKKLGDSQETDNRKSKTQRSRIKEVLLRTGEAPKTLDSTFPVMKQCHFFVRIFLPGKCRIN